MVAVLPKLFGQKVTSSGLPPLSKAVTTAADAAVLNLCRKTQQGNATASDGSAALEALATFFAYSKEVGYTSALEARLKAALPSVLGGANFSTHQAALLLQLQSAGISVTDDVRQSLSPDSETIQQFASSLRSIGLVGIEGQILQQFSRMVAPARISDTVFTVRSGVHLREVNCAANGIAAGILALLSPPPLDALFGAVAVTYDMMAAMNVC